MRKRHQAILINENAKNKIINELSLFGRTEREQVFKLNNFYEEFIPDNDIEIAPKTTITNDQKNELMQLDVINNNNEFKCDDNEYEESVIISEIKLPTYDESGKNALPKLQFQILNKADLGDFHYDKSNYLKEKTIKISNSKSVNLSRLSNKANERFKEKEKEKEKLKEKEKENRNVEIRQTKTKKLINRKEKYLLTEKNKSKKDLLDKQNYETEINNNNVKVTIENNLMPNCGPQLNFKDIINQMVFWTEENKNKNPNKEGENRGKRKRGSVMYETKINLDMILPKVNSYQLFNINPKKIIKTKEIIMEMEKQIKFNGKLPITKKNIINGFLEFQNEIINEKNQEITNLANELERIDSIVYGDNWSISQFKK
jgi:hypothetical protein